jgi:hypothetical protein
LRITGRTEFIEYAKGKKKNRGSKFERDVSTTQRKSDNIEEYTRKYIRDKIGYYEPSKGSTEAYSP